MKGCYCQSQSLLKTLLFFIFCFLFNPIGAQELPMDYSFCGYHRSESPIPSAKVVAYVVPTGSDDAALIQSAIDYVSRQKVDGQTGLRGAVLLGG